MRCLSVYRFIFIKGIVFSCHLSKNDISYYDSCQNSGLFKMKPLIGKQCLQNVGFFGPHHVPIWEKPMQTWRVSLSALLHAAVTSFV